MNKRASSIALSVGAVAVALGSGYFMENSAPTVSTNVKPAPVQVAVLPAAPAQEPKPQADLSEIQLTASPLPEIPTDIFQELNMPSQNVQRVAVTEEEIIVPDQVEVQGGFSCSIEMTADATIAAMVNIEIRSSCLPDTRVTLHHNGLMVSEMTDDQGELFLTMPALSETAVFIADFGQDSAIATVQVPSLRFYDRAVVQWQGVASLHLHALEFGAEFGQDGHIWDEQTGDLEKTIHGESGFLSLIGDPDLAEGMQAQVYTFPSGTTSRVGDISLEIEAEVTAETCGREISAQSMQISEAGVPRVQELQMTMPDCDAVGDFLVLKNVLEDLKVAAK
jgi:hypothetical protein